MGCDIHLYVERRMDGVWESPEKWIDEYKEGGDVPYEERYYNDRNYNLFAMLADVRNGRGFAGIRTGEGFNPISEPRGLPPDVSPNVKSSSDRWDVDGHSHSYLTVAELLAYDWTQVTTLTGVLSAQTFFDWDGFWRNRGDSPECWSGAISGPNVIHIPEEEMRKRLSKIPKQLSVNDQHVLVDKYAKDCYCQCEWKRSYAQCCSDFLAITITKLLRLGKPDDVRIVFWFDN